MGESTARRNDAQLSKPGLAARMMSASGWKAALQWALVTVLALRVVLGSVMAGVWLALKPMLLSVLYANPNAQAIIPIYEKSPADFLLGVWLRWDAVHYVNLAREGYAALPAGDSVFYPLYPFLIRVTSWLTFGEPVSAALIVSTLSALATFALLYRLAEDDFGPSTARWSVVALAVYPTALFLVAPFTEGLFLALTMGAFYLARRQRWLLAGVLGLLASLSRGPGVYTALALAWVAWSQWRAGARSLRRVAAMLAGLALPVAGGLAFLVWRAWAGYAPADQVLRQFYNLQVISPITGLWLGLREMVVKPGITVIFEGLSALLWLAIAAAILANHRWRRPEWFIFIALNLVVFFSKHSLTATPLQSLARYVLVLFPGFIILGSWLNGTKRWPRFLIVVAGSITLMITSVMYVLAVFLG